MELTGLIGKVVLGGAKAFLVVPISCQWLSPIIIFYQCGSDDRAVLKRLSTDKTCCVPAHITAAGGEFESKLLRQC